VSENKYECVVDQERTSNALGGLASSRRTLLDMQQRAAGGFHGRYLKIMATYQKSFSPIDAYLFQEQ